jgi:hypothetical protein
MCRTKENLKFNFLAAAVRHWITIRNIIILSASSSILTLKSISISSARLSLCYISGLPGKNYMRVECNTFAWFALFVFHDLITLKAFVGVYKLFSPSQCNFLHHPVTFFRWGIINMHCCISQLPCMDCNALGRGGSGLAACSSQITGTHHNSKYHNPEDHT